MAPKQRGPSFVCEIELRASAGDRRVLRSRMEAARQLYNAVLGELLGRLDAARRDPAWKAARKLRGKKRTAAFRELRARYGLSEYASHKHPSLARACWLREHLDANTAQKVTTQAWRAVEQHMFRRRGRPRFRRRGELRSLEGKRASVGIRLLGWGESEPIVAWDGAHAKLRLSLAITEHDPLHEAALKAPVRYVRIVRREIRDAERYFAQLVCAGQPPIKRPAREGGSFGIDVGPAWVAVADADGNAASHKLAPGAEQNSRARRRYQRRIDRRRRANNPECFDGKGRAIRGKRPKRRSKGLSQ